MSAAYRIFGSEMSPYSVKVRSYFRYKGLPHEWLPLRPDTEEQYRGFAKLPIVPTVATPAGEGLQDSTPIIEAMETQYPDPTIHPPGPVLSFLSALLEEFGDEWANKLMFHHRWWSEVDIAASAQTLARLADPGADEAALVERAAVIRQRMTSRGHFVGSSAATAPLIRSYLMDLLELLERHLARRKYLFGGRPSYGDFGLAAQLYQASVDPTCGSIIRSRALNTLGWCHRMLEPRDDGPFETWDDLAPTLTPILTYVGDYFLPWTSANAEALAQGVEPFSVELAGKTYVQSPQKYHAKSLAVLRAKRAAVTDPKLGAILQETRCEGYLHAT